MSKLDHFVSLSGYKLGSRRKAHYTAKRVLERRDARDKIRVTLEILSAANLPMSMQNLSKFLRAEKAAGRKIYPPGRDIFRAFSLTPFDQSRW